jgi:hypothetical protein
MSDAFIDHFLPRAIQRITQMLRMVSGVEMTTDAAERDKGPKTSKPGAQGDTSTAVGAIRKNDPSSKVAQQSHR